MADSPNLTVADLRALARLCDATRALTLSGRLDPDAVNTLRTRLMSIEPTDDRGAADLVVVAQLEQLIDRSEPNLAPTTSRSLPILQRARQSSLRLRRLRDSAQIAFRAGGSRGGSAVRLGPVGQ